MHIPTRGFFRENASLATCGLLLIVVGAMAASSAAAVTPVESSVGRHGGLPRRTTAD
jgi:hypothetical protein